MQYWGEVVQDCSTCLTVPGVVWYKQQWVHLCKTVLRVLLYQQSCGTNNIGCICARLYCCTSSPVVQIIGNSWESKQDGGAGKIRQEKPHYPWHPQYQLPPIIHGSLNINCTPIIYCNPNIYFTHIFYAPLILHTQHLMHPHCLVRPPISMAPSPSECYCKNCVHQRGTLWTKYPSSENISEVCEETLEEADWDS